MQTHQSGLELIVVPPQRNKRSLDTLLSHFVGACCADQGPLLVEERLELLLVCKKRIHSRCGHWMGDWQCPQCRIIVAHLATQTMYGVQCKVGWKVGGRLWWSAVRVEIEPTKP